MSKQSKKFMLTAVVFRNIFFAVFTLLLIATVTLAVLGAGKLQTVADDVRSIVSKADAIDQTNTRTITLWDELQENEDTAVKASQIVADSKHYAYQNVIIRDLESFARRAGITITNYDFTVVAPVSTQPDTATPQTEEGANSETPSGIAPSANGSLKTMPVNVSIAPSVNYERLMTFIHYIEQNLTKMQISKVSLSRSGSDNPRSVESDVLTIEVYVQ